jgi:CheY-like chemotaxis protein
MSLEQRSVLVCGPDPDLLDLLCSRLRRLGCRVRPTQCAEQAAAYAANEPFALAVVDGQASNVGARSLSAHLSEQPRAVRVIVLVDSSTPCPSLAASDRDFRVETRVDSANNGPNAGPAYKRVARLHSWRELEHAVHEAFEADRLAEENVAAEAVFA